MSWLDADHPEQRPRAWRWLSLAEQSCPQELPTKQPADSGVLGSGRLGASPRGQAELRPLVRDRSELRL